MTNTYAHADERVLAQLRDDFPGHRVWRSTRYDGRPGEWVATLHDPAAGVDPTVIRSEPEALREALVVERKRAAVPKTW